MAGRSYHFIDEPSKWRFSYLIIFSVIFLIIGGGCYWFFRDNHIDISQLPVIEADPGPMKIMPENVGKADVPHQDKLFYNQVSPKKDEPVTEHLLPSPEEPLQIDDLSSEPDVIMKEIPLVEKPAPTKIAVKLKFRVQIAAFSSAEAARREWNRLLKLTPLLKSQDVYYSRVDLGAKKGIYYRVQVGKFADKVAAQNFCRKLESQKLTCMVVPYKK